VIQDIKPRSARSNNFPTGGRATRNGGRAVLAVLLVLCLASAVFAGRGPAKKKRILVVDSYHRGYLWTQETSKGFCAALLKFGYFDDQDQIAEYTEHDHAETSRAVIQRLWMDAKRKNSKAELTKTTLTVTRTAAKFRPDIIFLGDEEAGKYIGNQFLDTRTPVVFWGFSGNPLKYGLADTAERPGHNITGVYLAGYYRESLQLLKRLSPGVRTFAILTDDSPSGRAREKGMEFLSRQGVLPVKLIGTLATNDFERWKEGALALQKMTDAFFVAEYSTLKDQKGETVSTSDVARWYLENIKIPEATLGFFVKQGLLCAADEPGYDQAFEAASMGRDILEQRADPATYPTRSPKRGALIVNARRARSLGIELAKQAGVEEYEDERLRQP
jgi:putative ABC transport system substrate-binding protein